MLFFGIVITILFCTFGLIVQSINMKINVANEYMNETESANQTEIGEIWSFKDMINVAYWPIFGYTDKLQSITDFDEPTANNSINSEILFKNFNFSLLFLYMIAILVLVNLLIAMLK